jgi:hypothetical protein
MKTLVIISAAFIATFLAIVLIIEVVRRVYNDADDLDSNN